MSHNFNCPTVTFALIPLSEACRHVSTSNLLLLQTVTKNVFTIDLTKLLGPDAFTHAPRLLMQLIHCSEKGKVGALSPPLPGTTPPPSSCPGAFCTTAVPLPPQLPASCSESTAASVASMHHCTHSTKHQDMFMLPVICSDVAL